METCQQCGRSIEGFEPVFLIENQAKAVCRECHDTLRPLCPYCQAALSQRPNGRRKCHSCGNFFYDERRQRIFASTILTKAQLAEVRTVWSAGIDRFGILEPLYLRRKQELTQSRGSEPNPADVIAEMQPEIKREHEIRQILDDYLKRNGIWIGEYASKERELHRTLGRQPTPNEIGIGLWNELISHTPHGDHQAFRQLYLNLARWKDRRGLDPFPNMQQAEAAQLEEWMAYGSSVTAVQIVLLPGACKYCREGRRRVLGSRRSVSLTEARAGLPLPFRQCTSGFTCCMYEAVFVGDRA